jgi:type II secretory pathway component PulF
VIDYAAADLSVPLSRRILRGILRGLFWLGALVFGCLLVGGLVLLFVRGVGQFAGYIGLVGGFLLLANLAWALTIKRRTQARVVLQHVHDAVQLGLPLPELLESAAMDETRAVRKQLKRVVAELRAGHPISSALETHLPALTLRARGMIVTGEMSGRLSHALRAAIDDLRPTHSSTANHLLTAGLAGMLSVVVIVLLAVFVFPRWMSIARDFRITLPAQTQLLLDISGWVERFSLPLLLLMLAMMMIIVTRLAARVLQTRRASPPGVLARGWQRLVWRLPVIGALTHDRSVADALAVLADGIEQERPLPAALRSAAMPHVNDVLRERLHHWADASQQGIPMVDAARAASMPASLIELLSIARGSDDVAGAARLISRIHADRRGLREAFVRSATSLLLTLVGGLVVWWIASSLILMLVTMVDTVNAEVL